ncbi:MAG: DUF1501 domain-containing protein [Phycisphaerales bacterium]|nr:MAG: DUF1501 domain-containing protein [Phycisphaerales bacterium]
MQEQHFTYSRRRFLQQGLMFASSTAVPVFVERSAFAMMQDEGALTSSRPGVPEDRVLVIVELTGGNDGLNTVVPFGSAEYYQLRPGLAVPSPVAPGDSDPRSRALVLDLSAGLGLHPSLERFKRLYDNGFASVVQGVGYPNPNRSHFASMDIWHTARTRGAGNGWIGRCFDSVGGGTPVTDGEVALGRTAPLALIGEDQKPITFETADMFRWQGGDLHEALNRPYERITRADLADDVDPDSQLAFLVRTTRDAQLASDRIRAAVEKTPMVSYPRTLLARQLSMVGAMIRDEMKTRVYYVSLSGFDTHANQAGRHSNLLRQLGDALYAFQLDLQAQGNSERVLTMVFSEFGRRVAQNASGGTDHGTAAPVYLVGDMVRPGLLGVHPSMSSLDQGDLVFNLDFRCVYAAILEDWMGVDATEVLGRQYKKARILGT